MSTKPRDEAAEAAILRLCGVCGTGKSISPSEAARLLDAETPVGSATDKEPDRWRCGLPRIRQAAVMLAKASIIEILRKGKPIAPEAMRGVVRLRLRAEGKT